MAMLTLMGLMTFDPTLFENVTVPEDMDKDTLIDAIIFECVELEVLISDPAVMKTCITAWAKKNAEVWSRLWTAMHLEYNPIWNKDGVITESETGNNGSESKVSAFNTENYVNSGRIDSASIINRTRTEQGNIGITTTQDMLKQELDVSQFNVYDYIAKDFKSRFCICVY